MKFGLPWLRLSALVACLWGIPVDVRAALFQPAFEKSVEKLDALEHKQGLENGVRPWVKQAGEGSQVNSGALFSVEGVLTEGDAQLDDGSLYDVHVFEGEAGQIVRIVLASEENGTLLVLRNASGEILADKNVINSANAEIVFRLVATGRYQIFVNAYNESSRGNYQLIVEQSDEDTLRRVEFKAEADRLFQQGIDPQQSNQYQSSLDSLQLALNIYREIEDREGEAASLGNSGIESFNLGNPEQAIDFYQQSLAICREIEDRLKEAYALNNIGNVYNGLADYEKAIDFYQQSLATFLEIENRLEEAKVLGNIGNVYNSLDDYEQAIAFYRESLVLAREFESPQAEATALGGLGNVYNSQGKYEQAIDFHQQSLAIARKIDSPQAEASSLTNLGNVYNSQGKYEQAIDFYQQSLAIKREIGDRQGEANSLANLGSVYDSQGKYEQAIDFYQQSLTIAREIESPHLEATSLGNLGSVYNSQGKYAQAIDFNQQSLTIAREIESPQTESNALTNLGNVYSNLGNDEKSIDFHQQSLAIARKIESPHLEATSLGNLGNVYSGMEEYEKAIAFHQQSLVIFREIGEPQEEAASLTNLGNVYNNLADYDQAVDLYQQSLVINREIGDRQGEATALGNLGVAYYSLADYEQAVNLYQQSLAIKREIGDRQGEANALTNLGEAYLKKKVLASAVSSLFDAISIYESLRTSELLDQDRINFFETQTQAYTDLVRALVSQNQYSDALEVSERGRTRSFVHLISGRLAESSETQTLEDSLSFGDMQKVAEAQQSVLVEYSLVTTPDDTFLLYIWVMQPTGKLDFRQVPLGDDPARLAELVRQSRESIGVRGRGFVLAEPDRTETAATDKLRELHQLMIEPIADLLPTDPEKQVVFIPQGDLFLVPFPALMNASGEYLVEQHTMLTAPSIQVLDLTRQQATANADNASADLTALLAVGNPVMPEVWNPETGVSAQLLPLMGAEQEANAVADFFNTEALLGAEATEQIVKQQMGNARIVHLATHGLLEYGTPEESGVRDVPGAIALTPTQDEDGLLTAAEILELDLKADLVVLSACDTGLGTITGDGVIGLSRSLIAAGTPSVIVSLWSIPDAPTADLMTEFYRQRQQGKDKAQALRQAMLTTMETHPNPGDWAAFTLIGEAD
jgi:CHAT domain-containing protein/uncharacterized protein HemY